MTKREAVLISAYTGYLLVADFSDVAEYCQKVLGRPIYTHEYADPDLQRELQDKLRPRIAELIRNLSHKRDGYNANRLLQLRSKKTNEQSTREQIRIGAMPEGFCSCDELREKGACGEMRSETNKEFPMRLRRLREQKRMKRRVLGELCGLGKNAIGRYERGEREPTLSAVVALADFFGVSVDYMLGKDENQS